jgi:hypothetical protein
MAKQELPHILWDLAKILGGVVKDTLDVGNYRITVMIEKKVDDNIGIVMETITVDKRMSALDVEIITKALKELVEKK